MDDIKIFEQVLLDISKFALFVGGLSSSNPTQVLNEAILKYTDGVPHNQFVDIKLNNPWTRVIISGINQLKLFPYTDQGLLQMERYNKLNQLNKSL